MWRATYRESIRPTAQKRSFLLKTSIASIFFEAIEAQSVLPSRKPMQETNPHSQAQIPDASDFDPGAFEEELIAFFVHSALALGLPRSVGTLYGYLYGCEEPQPFEVIVERLQISGGSASQGLRFLESISAVHRVYLAGDRRSHYRAEISLRALISGLLENKIRPHLESSNERIELLHTKITKLTLDDPRMKSRRAILKNRVEAIQTWLRKTQRYLRLTSRFYPAND